MNTLRWGVLGTGKIVNKMGPAIHQAANSDWIGVAGRTVQNSESAAKKWNVPRAYSCYQELLNDPEVDAVYIALLNHLHLEWTLKAIEAGKHVLCEKPFTLNAVEAELIRKKAMEKNVQVMEAFVWRFLPAHRAVKQMIDTGVIGDVSVVHAHFSFVLHDPQNSTRMVKDWGGGCLYDIGCYPISFSRYFIDNEPSSVDGDFQFDPLTGVDTRFAGSLYFEDGKTAQISCGFDTAGGCYYEIIGTKGRLRTSPILFNTPTTITLTTPNGSTEQTFEKEDQYRLQVEEFSDCILSNRTVPFGLDDAVANMRVIDALFQSGSQRQRIHIKA